MFNEYCCNKRNKVLTSIWKASKWCDGFDSTFFIQNHVLMLGYVIFDVALIMFFWNKCGLWETLFVCVYLFIFWNLQKISTFSEMKCNIIKRERWLISLFMTFTHKKTDNWYNKTNSRKKIKWIFTYFGTSASSYMLCVFNNLFILFFLNFDYSFLILYISSIYFQRRLNRWNPMSYEKVRMILNLGEIVKIVMLKCGMGTWCWCEGWSRKIRWNFNHEFWLERIFTNKSLN